MYIMPGSCSETVFEPHYNRVTGLEACALYSRFIRDQVENNVDIGQVGVPGYVEVTWKQGGVVISMLFLKVKNLENLAITCQSKQIHTLAKVK